MLKQYFKKALPTLVLFGLILLTVNTIIYLGRNTLVMEDLVYLNILLLLWMFAYILYDGWRYFSRYKTLFKEYGISTEDLKVSPLDELLYRITNNKDKAIQKHSDRNKDFRDFLLGWIHEAKTPIAAMKLIIDQQLPQDLSGVFTTLEEQRLTLDNRIQQILYYTRIDDFEKDYKISNHSIQGMISTALKEHKTYFISKSMVIDLNIEDCTVLTDEKWVQFILSQVLSNSIKYSPKNSTLHISTVEDMEHIDLVITDEGMGIGKEDLPRIFDRGFTGSIGRMPGEKATGLGLYLAKELCHKLGHDLLITSQLDIGTTVILRFYKNSTYMDM